MENEAKSMKSVKKEGLQSLSMWGRSAKRESAEEERVINIQTNRGRNKK